MRFSIITVTKNNKEGLLRAIECVRNQTYQNIEHLIVDGDSTDGSVEAIKNEQLKIKNLFFVSESDNGIYDAINKGIKLATGDVIGLLHSDDLFAGDFVLEKYAEAFDSHSGQAGLTGQIDAVYSDLVYVKFGQEARSKESEVGVQSSKLQEHSSISAKQDLAKGGQSKYPAFFKTSAGRHSIVRNWKTQKEEFTTEAQRHKALKFGWMPPHPTLFIRKAIFEKYGLYSTELKIASDYEMILSLFYKHKITTYYLPLTTYLMSIGGASNKSLSNILLKSKEDLLALKLHNFPHPLITLLSKNLRKLPQFLAHDLF